MFYRTKKKETRKKTFRAYFETPLSFFEILESLIQSLLIDVYFLDLTGFKNL